MIVFANVAQANPARIAHGIAAIYNPEFATVPAPAIKDNEPEVTSLAKKVWQQILDGELQSELFESNAFAEISANANIARGTLKSLGTLKSMELTDRSDQDDRRIYRYRLMFADTTLNYVLVLTKQGKICGLRIQP